MKQAQKIISIEKSSTRKRCNIESISASAKKKLEHEEIYLRSIPSSFQYEKSFMHRDVVTQVFSTKRDFIITASQDGHLKFWKKIHGQGIEFVKHFRCHSEEFSSITLNYNDSLMATCSKFTKTLKVFDVANFDMINILQLNFFPKILSFVHRESDFDNALAVSNLNSGEIVLFDAKGENIPIHIIKNLHLKPIILMEYCPINNITISIDEIGMIEYWSGTKTNFEFPKNIYWEYKTDTDLYEFIKIKQIPKSLIISPNGKTFAIILSDRNIYVFDLLKSKILKKLDESLSCYNQKGKETMGFGLPNMEWNRRMAIEKDLNRDTDAFKFVKAIYDESSNFLIYPTPIGISVYNLVTDELVRQIGKVENVRFLNIALCRAVLSVNEKLQGAATSANVEAADNPNLKNNEPDPMLIACAYKRNRFYIFTKAEPYSTDDGGDNNSGSRDIFNEKPTKEDIITSVEDEKTNTKFSNQAVIHTTFGDIHLELFNDQCPKTVDNFCTHARRGYYNGHTFHRVIKSFMIQTGDPTGKGTGGQSIWGDDFEDEFHPMLRHDKPFRLSMANAGPNTNGSQFFITVVPAEWLDGKNTLFGQVTEGFNVVQKINQIPTYERSGRPRQEISIISISLKGCS